MDREEPQSMAEYFATEPRLDDQAPVAEDAVEEELPLDADLEDGGVEDDEVPDDDADGADEVATLRSQIAARDAEIANRDRALAQVMWAAAEQERQNRQREQIAAEYRWRQGLATGELTQDDVRREQMILQAQHQQADVIRLQQENQRLRQFEESQIEAQAKVQAIDLIAKRFALTPREVSYLGDLGDPYEMERLAARFQSDRRSQTAAARKAQAAQRAGNPVDRAPNGRNGAARPPEPESMEEYFASLHRR